MKAIQVLTSKEVDFIYINKICLDTWNIIKEWVISFNDSIARNFVLSLGDSNFILSIRKQETITPIAADSVVIRNEQGEYFVITANDFSLMYLIKH